MMADVPDHDRLARTLAASRAFLLGQRVEAGHWRGELSGSALATAVAAVALHQADGVAHRVAIARALDWLVAHANADGGWGDSPDSPSNLSTTLLCWSALAYAEPGVPQAEQAVRAAEAWVTRAGGRLKPGDLAAAVLRAYGGDRTFSAPILTVCALSGRLGADPWQYVPQLPFELALLPHRLFRFVRLSVVSYAIPALIAIGLARHRHAPGRSPVVRRLRESVVRPALRILERCQPVHGGYLEAAPLTAFVAMSLAASGLREHPVTAACVRFLLQTVRPDGHWPIDTDLSTWLTTLSLRALSAGGDAEAPVSGPEAVALRGWLLGLQTRAVHPFTRAAPGGWSWTSLAGGVPDADDTAGALLALHALGGAGDSAGRAAARAGLRWLLDLQNGDGGLPTFCRGWGHLPFDRSCPDITAHALRAFDVWRGDADDNLRRRLDKAVAAAMLYLEKVQQSNGSWVPLWFGNQRAAGQLNPAYGTAQVVAALARLTPGRFPRQEELAGRGVRWLLAAQNGDGGWGGAGGVPSSIEETALAVAALAAAGDGEAALRGAGWLMRATAGGTRFAAAPIGLYFSSLWYSERLYPVIFTVEALSACRRLTARGRPVP
jgi:squalene-hopene/tetraprenyl-beta-curcumene cyclase